MAVTLTGNEVLQVQGIASNGLPSGQTFACATQDIANLSYSGNFGGQFTLTGTTAVTVTNTSVATTDVISYSLAVVGGTVGAFPIIKTINAGSFTVAGAVGDTSTYNYAVSSIFG